MNAMEKSRQRAYTDGSVSKKTVSLRLIVTDRDLEQEIKTAFDLAKSEGQDLDLTFSLGPSAGVPAKALQL
jgi:hypothetical protein